MTYAEKLQDPRWLEFRARLLKKRGPKCQQCDRGEDEDEPTIQVHHVCYIRGRAPWEYPEELLICLCPTCHLDRQVHDEEAQFEFARLCAWLSSWEVYELSKQIRFNVDSGRKPKLFDAYATMVEQYRARG